MSTLWKTLLYKPLANALLFLVSIIPGGNIGLAVIVLTILVKILLLPLSFQSLRTQLAQKRIQPKLDELKKTITDKQEQAKAMMQLYKENGIRPFASILVLLIQLPIIIALYRVFLGGLDALSPLAYSGLALPPVIQSHFLGISMIEKSTILAILAAVAQFLQIHFSPLMRMNRQTTVATDDPTQLMAQSMQRSMKYIMPIMVLAFAFVVPGAVALYWIVSSLATLIQEIIIYKRLTREKLVTTVVTD